MKPLSWAGLVLDAFIILQIAGCTKAADRIAEVAAIEKVIENNIAWFRDKDFDLLFTTCAHDPELFMYQQETVFRLPDNFGSKSLEHVEQLAAIGIRSAGTENDMKAASYIDGQFQKANIETTIEMFEFESFEIEKTNFIIGQKPYTLTLIGFNPYEGLNSFRDTAFLFDNDHFMSGIDPSEAAGKAVISNNPDNYFRLMLMNPRLILYVDKHEFEELKNLETCDFALEIQGRYKKHQSSNVVAIIGNKSADAKEIIVSAHYDSFKTSPGADDNGSGVGVLIELAKYFHQIRIPAGFMIKFVAFGAEEIALVGSRDYLESHSESLEQCELLINLDQVGGSGEIYIEMEGGVTGIPEKKGVNQFPGIISGRSGEGIEIQWKLLEPEALVPFMVSNHPQWLVDVIDTVVKELGLNVIPAGNMGSDQIIFAQAGIPSTGIAIFGNEVHNALDTPEKVNTASLKSAGEITAGIVLKTIEHFNH